MKVLVTRMIIRVQPEVVFGFCFLMMKVPRVAEEVSDAHLSTINKSNLWWLFFSE
jgi:hypothetical protein